MPTWATSAQEQEDAMTSTDEENSTTRRFLGNLGISRKEAAK